MSLMLAMYKFSEVHILDSKFQRIFKVPFLRFYDGLISVASGRLVLDILKFDDFLKSNGMDEEKESIQDFVYRVYGKEAVDLLIELL